VGRFGQGAVELAVQAIGVARCNLAKGKVDRAFSDAKSFN